MPDRQDIQQRLQALESFERAQSLHAQGHIEEALQAARNSLSLMPDFDQARALVDSLQQSGHQAASEQDHQVTQLIKGLTDAEHGRQWDRVIALSEAILALTPHNLPLVSGRIAHACRALISSSRCQDIEVAASWAKTWQRLSNDPEAAATYRQIQESMRLLADVERDLQHAIRGEEIAALKAAMAPLHNCADRTRRCLALFQRATQELQRREIAAARLRAEIAAIGGSDLDQACQLSRQLAQLDGSEESRRQRDDLHQRAQMVTELEDQLRKALASNHNRQIAAAITAVEQQIDRLSGTQALIDEARERLASCDDEIGQLCDDFDGISAPADLPTRIRIAEQLARIAPDDERVSQLPALRRSWERLQDQCQRLESLLHTQDQPQALIKEGERLARSSEQTATTRDLAHKARQLGQRLLARRRRVRRWVIFIAIMIGTPSLAIGILAMINHRQVHNLADHPPSLAVVDSLRSYPSHGWQIFARPKARRLANNMYLQLDRAAWIEARDETNTATRARLLRDYLDVFEAGHHRADASQELLRTQDALIRQAFTDALADEDTHSQRQRLEELLRRHGDHPAAEWAQDRLAAQHREADRIAWQACRDEDDLERRIALIDRYLAGPDPLHAPEAQAARNEAEHILVQQRTARNEEQAWQEILAIADPQQRHRALRTYQESTTNQDRRARAQEMMQTLAVTLDDAAWAKTKDGDARQRRAALQQYLAAEDLPQRRHLSQAAEALAAIDRAHDTELWQAVLTAPGPTEEQAAIEHYLKTTDIGLFQEEATQRLTALGRRVAEAEWLTASSISDPIRRLAALDVYLTQTEDPIYLDRARQRISVTINQIARLSDTVLAGLPVEVLRRLPSERLLECNDAILASLAQLPLQELEGLDVRVLARLPRRAIRRLSVSTAARVRVLPPWADEAGNDRHGRWASIVHDDVEWRFRYLFPGALGADVVVHRGAWLLEHEVTRQQWAAVVSPRSDPSRLPGNEHHPADHVRWRDTTNFIRRFSNLIDNDDPSIVVRLPTRQEMLLLIGTIDTGPRVQPYPQPAQDPTTTIAAIAWHRHRADGTQASIPARHLDPDAWGVYGILGNLGEWLHDDPPPTERRHQWFLDASYNSDPDTLWPQPSIISISERERLPHAGFRIAITDPAE